MSGTQEGELAPAPAPEAAPSPEELRAPSPPLCSGEAGKEYELSVLTALIESNHNHYYVLPAGVLKNEQIASLVFCDASLGTGDMQDVHEEIHTFASEPAKALALGDVVGVDIVMLPIAALNDNNAPAARAMLKLVEVKSTEKVSANTVCGSLALQLWMHRRNVRRQWLLYAPCNDSVAPLLCTQPKFMLGFEERAGLFHFCTDLVGLTPDIKDMQAAFREATLPAKDILEAVRDVRRHQDSIETKTAAAASAFAYLMNMLNTHEACLKVAQERQEACRARRNAKKRDIEELYRDYY